MPEHITGNLRINYVDHGDGPAVLLLHSSGASSRQWQKLTGDYGSSYRFLAPDLIGYGKTSGPSDGVYATTQEVALVEALVGMLDQPVHLVGHSFGGGLALDAALSLGDRVRSVTAIEPVLFQVLRSAGETEAWTEIEAVATAHIRLVEAGDDVAAADRFMAYWIGGREWAAMPDSARAKIIASMPKIANEWRGILTESRKAEIYEAIRAPVRFIRATETTLAAHRVTDVLLRALPAATLTEIAGAGHLSPITHADRANALIIAGLESTPES